MQTRYDSLSMLSFVGEPAHQDGHDTGERNRSPGNVADDGIQGQERGEPQGNAAVSRCILRAVWLRVAVRGNGSSVPSQPSLVNPLQHVPSNRRDPMVSPTQTARVWARGRSLTPKPLTSNPKPVSSNRRATSLILSTSRLSPDPGSDRSRELQPLQKASNSRAGSCLGGDPIVFNRVSESAVPRRDHITMQFDATKGYPGEGPPVPQPCTPPKGARQPKTPPKAPPKVSGGRPVKLTSSVRRLGPPPKVDPGVKTPPKPPPARSRTPRVPPKPPPVKPRRAANEPESPGKRGSEGAAPIRVVRPKFDVGFNYEEARAKLMSAPGGYPQATTLPEVRPAILFNPSTRFTQAVPKLAPKAIQEPGEQLDEAGVREVRPIPKVEASSLIYARPTPKRKGVASSPRSGQSSEPAVPQNLQSSGVSVELGARGRSHAVGASLEPAGREGSPSPVDSPEPANPKVCTPPVDSPEPANPKVCTPPVGSPEPANPKVCTPPVGSPGPANPKVRATPIGSPESTVPVGSEDAGARPESIGKEKTRPIEVRVTGAAPIQAGSASGGHEADVRGCEGVEGSIPGSDDVQQAVTPDPLVSKTSDPVGTSTEADSDLSRSRGPSHKQGDPLPVSSHQPGAVRADIVQSGGTTEGVKNEEARPAHKDSTSSHVTGVTSLEGVGLSPARTKEYAVTIEVQASADPPCRAVKITYAPGKVEQIKVHGSRRVLEILLLTWRSGVQLEELSRHIQGAEGSAVSMDASIRVPVGRLIVGSVLTATYARDPCGHPAEVNASLVQTLLESPQGSEAHCNRCDPLRNARIFVQSSRENVPMLMNLRMQLRAYPIGTTCEEALTELRLQSHTIVGLCRAFTHWVPVPKQFRMQPSWCTLVWPVPGAERTS